MTAKAKIFSGKVMHCRLKPVRHEFVYPLYWYSFDLDSLTELSQKTSLFSYNKKNIVSIYDKDYLTERTGSIKEKLLKLLESTGHKRKIEKVELVTSARYFNYVFNPVSFYYCYDENGDTTYHVAEINNTFNERHVYVMENSGNIPKISKYNVKKDFHISPFNDLSGTYDFIFSPLQHELSISVNIIKDEKEAFVSRLWGKSEFFSDWTLLKTLARFPISAVLTIPRIYWQAAKLHYLRGLPVYTKPNPSSKNTIKIAPPTLLEKIGLTICRKILSRMPVGSLIIEYPDGNLERFGSFSVHAPSTIKLKNYKMFWKVLKDGGIGFGESYVDGDWESDDLVATLKTILNNTETLDERYFNKIIPVRLYHRLRLWLKKNSIRGSRRNIESHYDLSNELFKKFLDPSMMYSSGIYKYKESTLEEAQNEKVSRIIDKAKIRETDSLLEIGSGWGHFAIEAAKKTGCKVTSISLSGEQLSLARDRAVAAKLDSKIDFKYADYRLIEGKYDRIVSIEMLEAVGQEYLGEFFSSCERLLNRNGIAVLQVITSPDSWYDSYCKRQDWIQKYIFPGSHLPCLTSLMEAIKKNSSLVVENIENIGPDYARTLCQWRINFLAQWENIKKQGFDEKFKRMWTYYLASCEAEFATRWLNVYQIVLCRPNNSYLVCEDENKQSKNINNTFQLHAVNS